MYERLDKYENLSFATSERKAMRAALGLFFALVAIALFLMSFNADNKIHVGAGWLYGAFAAELTAFAAAGAYVVLFVKRLWHIKHSKRHCTVLLVGIVIITAFIPLFAVDCTADIFGGAREITTNEYKISDNTKLHFTDGDENVYVFIPKDVGAEIAEVPLVSDNYSEAAGENGLYIHTESVYIKYYPRSKVLAEIRKA